MITTPDLFPDAPPTPRPNVLDLVAQPGIKLSPIQRAFKRLLDDIAAVEAASQEIAALIEKFRVVLANKLGPLEEERNDTNLEMLQFLDQQLLKKGWSARQQQTMREIICSTAEQLLDCKHGAQMRLLFDRHSDMSLAEVEAETKHAITEDLAAMLGIKVDPDDPDAPSPEEILVAAMRERHGAGAAGDDAADEDLMESMGPGHAAKRQAGKKSARQQKLEQQSIDAKSLLKDIYRKLTSALHPDREPDPVERARKTAMMTEANKAYEAANLLKLLELQQQVSRVDARAASTLADDALKVVNSQLKHQLATIRSELRELEAMGRETLYLRVSAPFAALAIEKNIKAIVATERADIKFMRTEIRDLKSGELSLKVWLREQQQFMREADLRAEAYAEEMLMYEMMEQAGHGRNTSSAKRRR